MQLRCVTCFCADVGLVRRGSRGTETSAFQRAPQANQPPEEINIRATLQLEVSSPRATRPLRSRALAPPEPPGSEAKTRGGDNPAPGPPRPPSPLRQGTWAPRPGSLTGKRSAARSRDAPALVGRRTGSRRPGSRGGAESRPERGREKCRGGVRQQLHQLSRVPGESAPAPAQFASGRRGWDPGMGTTHAP